MRHDSLQSLVQRLRRQGLVRHQQHGLVPMMTLRNISVEEPMLNRQQRSSADNCPLVDSCTGRTLRNRSQCLHSLILEQIFGRKLNVLLTRTADHLQ
ncbi:hypothetical protein D3C79_746530 [compost metagenome]